MIKESIQTCVIWGIPFGNVSFIETLEWIRRQVKIGTPSYIATANMDFIMQACNDPELQRILIEAGLVVADGAPIVKMSKKLGSALKERVTGSDLVPMIAGLAAAENFSIFMLGGAEGVAEKAAAHLRSRYPNLRIAGCYSPPPASILDMDHAFIAKRLRDAQPDILLVAFGAPKQEKWINMHYRDWQIPVAIGVGGTFDFLAGTQWRAPRWVQRINMEWLWRMASNPKRLARRYLHNIHFFIQIRRDLRRVMNSPDIQDNSWSQDALRKLSALHMTWPPADIPQNKPVILDLAGISWMTSDELGLLIDYVRQNRKVYLVRAGSRLMALFKLYRLDHYLLLPQSGAELAEMLQQNMTRDAFVSTLENGSLQICLPSEITAVQTAAMRAEFHTAYTGARAGHIKELTIDASHVHFLDSSAIGLLRHIKNTCEEDGVPFCCTGFHGDALTILQISRVAGEFSE